MRDPSATCFDTSPGTGQIRSQSRYITKTTCPLIDHLQSAGSFAQHREDFPETDIPIGFAVLRVLAAISLSESLTADSCLQEDSGRDTT